MILYLWILHCNKKELQFGQIVQNTENCVMEEVKCKSFIHIAQFEFMRIKGLPIV